MLYIYTTAFKAFFHNNPDVIRMFDNGDNLFLEKNVYNFIPVKDNKYIAMGNLEPKFQKTFNKVLVKDYKLEGETNLETVRNVLKDRDRDDIADKVVIYLIQLNTKTNLLVFWC